MDKKIKTLIQSKDSSSLLADLYQQNKERNHNFSLAFICQRAGIPSRGYLNDVIKGRRRLNPKYSAGICKAFGFTGFAKKYVYVFLALENEPDAKKRAKLTSKLKALLKVLNTTSTKKIRSDADHSFCFKLFACFGLFGGKPTEEQLLDVFPPEYAEKVKLSLSYLEREQCIEKIGDKWAVTGSNFVFRSQEWLAQYLHTNLTEAQQSLNDLPSKSDRTYFESSFISVKRDRYTAALSKLREFSEEFQSQLESSQADEVIQFSLQVFPVVSK